MRCRLLAELLPGLQLLLFWLLLLPVVQLLPLPELQMLFARLLLVELLLLQPEGLLLPLEGLLSLLLEKQVMLT
jgi:hypothetical protein